MKFPFQNWFKNFTYLGRASQGKAVKKLIYYSYNNFFLQCNYDEGDCCECNLVIISATIL